jgi:hypothetical protein
MANETTQSALDDLCAAIIAEARMVLSRGDDLSKYVKRRSLPKGKSGVTFPKYGSVTASALTEGTDITTNTQVTTTSATITPTQVGLMSVLTDMADWASDPVNTGADIGKLFADAIRAKRNQDIWALFDGFSQTAGTTNTDITEANIASCVRQLTAAKAPRPYYMAITPHVLEDLLGLYSTSTSITTSELRDMALNKGELAPIYGVFPLLVDNLASGTSAGKADGADAKCGVFSRDAIGMVEGYDLKIETQRDASMRGWEIVGTSFYAVGEIDDTFGVELLVDNKD